MTASQDKLRPFDAFVEENGFVVLDGGLATELEAQVLQVSNHRKTICKKLLDWMTEVVQRRDRMQVGLNEEG